MKMKIISLLLVLLTLFSVCSCGEYVAPSGGNEGVIGGNKPQTPANPGTDDGENGDTETGGGEEEETPFTVSLMLGGELFIPEATEGEGAVKIRWSDGNSVYTETLGADGFASAVLDGDYSVSVIGVPDGYTYDPNIYKATNDSKNVTVDLLKITTTKGSGNGLYGNSCIQIGKTGVYRADIKKATSVVYYEFTPPKAGVYSIESLVDISAEMYNPIVDIYNGSSAYKLFVERRDGGGVSGEYTTNFNHTVKISKEEIGGNCYTFGILLDGKDAVYPSYVDFEIKYLGDYQMDITNSKLMMTSFIPNPQTVDKNGRVVSDVEKFMEWFDQYAEYLDNNRKLYGDSNYSDAALILGGKRVFDQRNYRLNPDDGYYHRYDEIKYAAYGGWGPILYADITQGGIFIADPFNSIEYNGNKALTVSEGTENYKLFIEGYDELIIPHGDSGPYLCNTNCPCFKQGLNGGSCAIEENCTSCKSGCRHLPIKDKYQRGYADIAIEGRCPVTEELKEFLQKYSESERLFSDGNGWAEQHSPRYDAYEDSQWLFACGYYTD